MVLTGLAGQNVSDGLHSGHTLGQGNGVSPET